VEILQLLKSLVCLGHCTLCVRPRTTRLISGAIAECKQWWLALSRSSLVYPFGCCYQFFLRLIFWKFQPTAAEVPGGAPDATAGH